MSSCLCRRRTSNARADHHETTESLVLTVTRVTRSQHLRTGNRYRLLEALRRQGRCTRTDLGSLTGLSAAAVSTLSGALIDEGVLLEEARSSSESQARGRRRGRPKTQLLLAPSVATSVTLSLTIDRLQTDLLDHAGTCLWTDARALDTRALSRRALQNALVDAVTRAISEVPPDHPSPARLGVGFQGVTGTHDGRFLWSPILGIRDVPVQSILQDRFGIPVSVANDCRLIAAALYDSRADALGETFATVLFSSGVGLGLFIDGKAFSGTRSSALELGHLKLADSNSLCRCGARGCIEAHAADYAIVRHADGRPADATPDGRISASRMERVIVAALADEPQALAAFERAGTAIGDGLASLFTLFDPMPVVLVGQDPRAFALMREAIEHRLMAQVTQGVSDAIELHSEADADPLMRQGLARDTLRAIDRQLARRSVTSDELS